jgi:hypothetical protein
MQSAGNHEVKYQPQLVLETDGDALTDPTQRQHAPTLHGLDGRHRGPQQEWRWNPYALESPSHEAAIQCFDVDSQIRQLGHEESQDYHRTAANRRIRVGKSAKMAKRSAIMRRETMRKSIVLAVIAMSVTLLPVVGSAKGCIKGAAVGAVAGHVAGHHAVAGAAAGCVIQHHREKVKDKAAAQSAAAPQASPPAGSAAPAAPPKP